LEFQKYNVKKRRRKRERKKTNKQEQSRINYKENTGTKLITNTKKHKLKISFRRLGLIFWVPDVLCRHSEVVLWNLLGV